MKKKRLLLVSLVVLALLLLAGCAAGLNPTVDVPDTDGDIAGFWSGLWHGIISLFSDNVNVYEVFNSGNWYDFGFMFGIAIIFGGGARGAPRRKSY